MTHLERTDPEIARLIQQEETRQFESIRLIPSENYVSHAVLEATGTILTNKYSEGYPGKRYYEGQEFIDPIESIAQERAKRLFGPITPTYSHIQAPQPTRHLHALLAGTRLWHELPHGGT
jgi:glycine/serine hydroxymethyltransferase